MRHRGGVRANLGNSLGYCVFRICYRLVCDWKQPPVSCFPRPRRLRLL